MSTSYEDKIKQDQRVRQLQELQRKRDLAGESPDIQVSYTKSTPTAESQTPQDIRDFLAREQAKYPSKPSPAIPGGIKPEGAISGSLPAVSTPSTAALPELTQEEQSFVTTKKPESKLTDQVNDEYTAFTDNPLNEYQNWTYNWTFFMLGPDNWDKNGSDSLLSDNVPKIIIAESGTTGYAIKSVDIKHTVGPNFSTRNTNSMEFTMRILEPAGVTLFDRIYTASLSLGIHNYTKGAFFLGLKFLGYDEKGNIINPLPVKPIEGQTWVWRIFIKDIRARFENGIGDYEIEAIGFQELSNTSQVAQLKTQFMTDASKKIDELLGEGPGGKPGELEIFLNQYEAQYRRTGSASNKYKIQVHYNTWPDGWPKDKRELVHNSNKHHHPIRASSPFLQEKTGKTIGHFPATMKITEVIDLLMSNTPYTQALANRTNNNDAGDPADKKNEFSQIWRVETEVKTLEFDPVFNDYVREYIFHVYHYDSPRPVLNPQVNPGNESAGNPNINLMEENTQRRRIREIIRKNYLAKRYDYIYTGLNTEVLNLEIKFQHMWTAVQNLFMGTRDYGVGHVPPKLNEASRLRYYARNLITSTPMIEEAIQIQKLADIIEYSNKAAFGEQVISTDPAGNKRVYRVGADPDFENVLAEQEAARQEVARLQKIIAEKAAQQTFANAREVAGLRGPITGRVYLEELKVDIGKTPPVPITLAQEVISSERLANQSSDQAWQRGRSLLSSTMSQAHGGHEQIDLMEIELEIRGDPYWLGIGNVDTNFYSSIPSTQTYPNFKSGEHMFFLMFRMPTGFDEEGQLQFEYGPLNESKVMTGLYAVIHCTSRFEDGKFTQVLKALRDPNTNTMNVLK